MHNKKLFDLLDKIKPDKANPLVHYNSKVLIIDGMNTFLRSFAAVNHFNTDGSHIGGIVGFLKSIGYAIRIHKPTRVIITFDGEGGSINRKYLYPGYKANRDPNRKINFKSFDTVEDQVNAQINEVGRLIDYLSCLPVSVICLDRLEADDLIGYLSMKIYTDYDDSEVTIMSADRDFLQLVNDRIKVYSPTKKKLYDQEMVLQEYGVHPTNFLLFKTLLGDSGDNIPGVMGLGEKNIPKLFEFMNKPDKKTLTDLYEVCKNPPKNSVLYKRILEVDNQVEVFYKIMDLKEPNISDIDRDDIDRRFYHKPHPLRKYEFVRMHLADRLSDVFTNVESWLGEFTLLDSFLK